MVLLLSKCIRSLVLSSGSATLFSVHVLDLSFRCLLLLSVNGSGRACVYVFSLYLHSEMLHLGIVIERLQMYV